MNIIDSLVRIGPLREGVEIQGVPMLSKGKLLLTQENNWFLMYILFLYRRVVLHVDRFLSILQMSNSFANCFIYAKMHNQIRNTRSTKRLRSRHNNLTVNLPLTQASSLLNSRKSITSIITSSLSSNEYIGEQVLPLVTQINNNGALTATVVTKVWYKC